MAIEITRGTQLGNGTFGSLETYSQSTATGYQTLSQNHSVLTLGMGTATGFNLNRYVLASSTATTGEKEGMELTIQSGATGEAKVAVPLSTSTGAYVFQSDGDFVRLRMTNSSWREIDLLGPTIATASA
jgi:hypothetical protein